MKNMEKDIMCVLLQHLLDQNLITRDVQEKARTKVLDTLDNPEFFCYGDEKREEEADGYTQNSF